MARHSLDLELFYDGAYHAAPVYVRDGCTIMRGSTAPGNDTDPAGASATIDNHSGLYSPRSVASALHGKIGQNTKTRFTVDGGVRLVGEAASWRPERAIKNDAWTKLDVSGVLRRIGRGTDALQSPIYRSTVGAGPVAYWPMEDGTGATRIASALPDGVPAETSGTVNFARDDELGGSRPNPTVGTDAYLGFSVGHTFSGNWQVDWFQHVPAPFASDTTVMRVWTSGGTHAFWDFVMRPQAGVPSYRVKGYDSVGTLLTDTGGFSSLPFLTSDWAHVRMMARNEGGGTARIALVNFPVTGAGGFIDTTFTGTVGHVYYVQVLPQANLDGVAYGHLAVYDNYDFSAVDGSDDGYAGETAADRFTRLCTELGITPTVVGTAAESVAMGPQQPATFLDLLDEIARTDDANIFETRSDIGLTMRTGASKLNQAPDFTISYLGQIKPGLTPVFGDAGIRNDVTAASASGATRNVQQLTGPHNVQLPEDDPQGVGRYSTRIDVNPETNDALADAAGWRVNLGTFDGTWYLEITADLDAAPGIATAVAALDIGDCLALSDLPVDEALDTVESIIIGIREDVLPGRRTITFYCVPAEPYRVGLMSLTSGDSGSLLGNLDPDDSTTVGSTAAGAASFSVATASGPLWTTTADDFPLDVLVGGQRVSVSAISGASSPQTFTVQTTGKQIRFAIPAGSTVIDQQPIILSQ